MTGLNRGFSVLFQNAHLFGRTGRYLVQGAWEETPFYYRDHERLPKLIQAYKKSEADVIGVAEGWDEEMGAEVQSGLQSEYPYHFVAPATPGIGGVIDGLYERWPRLAGRLFGPDGGYVNRFTQAHYTPPKPGLLSEIGSYLSEDLLVRGLGLAVRGLALSPANDVFGAGLWFFSRYPIVSANFHPHEDRADWEMLAGKGVINAVVKFEEGAEVMFSLGHYQEGVSPRTILAREAQHRKARTRTRDFKGGVIHFGDSNIIAGSKEYERMMAILGLEDAKIGDTYHEPNAFQDKMKAPRGEKPRSQRIDYITYNSALSLHSAGVVPHLSGLSDHEAIEARFIFEHLSSAQDLASSGEFLIAAAGAAAAAG